MTTVTATLAVPVAWPLSVPVAVMRCVPAERTWLKLPPVPREPSRSEAQVRREVSTPSSRSVAAPAKAIGSPAVSVRPPTGAVMVTNGSVLAGGRGPTVTVTCAVPVKWSRSVTAAESVCRPCANVAVSVAPVPSAPCRSDRHARAEDRSPSTASRAVPWRVTVSPSKKAAPSTGCTIVTAGAGLVGTVSRSAGFCPLAAAAEL